MRLGLDELLYLPDEQKSRYRAYEQGFDTPFWKDLKELAEGEIENATLRGANAESWESNRIALGARIVWQYIATLEDAVENEFRQYIDQSLMERQQADQEAYE